MNSTENVDVAFITYLDEINFTIIILKLPYLDEIKFTIIILNLPYLDEIKFTILKSIILAFPCIKDPCRIPQLEQKSRY